MAQSLRRTLAATVVAAAAAAGPLAAQNAPAVTVGGVVYAQFAAQLDSAPPGTNSNFDITRAYLNVIGRFADGILTRVTGAIWLNKARCLTRLNGKALPIQNAFIACLYF